jgi:ATP-dependent Clp protease protease subunit
MSNPTNYYIPTVIEKSGSVEKTYDIFSRLIKDRIIFLGTEINDDVANAVVAQLLFLDTTEPGKEIQLWINSPGGVITSGMAIYDTMNFISSPVKTVCVGQACSMGAFLLSAGEPGLRVALPSARIMIHQPSGGAQGQSTDIQIQAKEIQRMKDELNGLIAGQTGQTVETVEKDTERDNFMSSQEALDYGLIDKVVKR